jgi:uncharacterized protein with HEPN domain
MRDEMITSQDRLEHIMEAIKKIEAFIQNHTRESFLNNDVVISATLFQFAIIGEAIRLVNNEILDKYKYPWHSVRAFRNFILHEYHAISYRIVWDAAKADLPQLKEVIAEILKKEF